MFDCIPVRRVLYMPGDSANKDGVPRMSVEKTDTKMESLELSAALVLLGCFAAGVLLLVARASRAMTTTREHAHGR